MAECGETFCCCGDCELEGSLTYASLKYLSAHPDVVVTDPMG